MPTDRITTAESQVLSHVRDAARECGVALTRAATRLLDAITAEPDAERASPYGRRTPHREPLLPLEVWLGAGCVVMVLWAVGWL